MESLKVILTMGDTNLVMSLSAATKIFQALIDEDPKLMTTRYEKDELGNYQDVHKIISMRPDRAQIKYLSAADYLRFCIAGDAAGGEL
jgi:hypothetical protein